MERLAVSIVTRFAPSPTGFLHLGHAFAALTAWQRARAAGGRFLLRLEDIDRSRCRPAFAEAILEDLAWLGLDWDGPVRVQSAHLAEYQAVLDFLAGEGMLYPCFCTRADISRAVVAPHTGDAGPLYPGTCRALPSPARAERIAGGAPYALRLAVDAALARTGSLVFRDALTGAVACDPARLGDVVLARKGMPASYHLCATHDDAMQGVTCVTRGADLLEATHVHRLLQALMGWAAPCYAHHRLLTDDFGRRLAKRDHAVTLRGLRAAGHDAAEVRRMVGF